MPSAKKRAIIIGAGPAGLTAAYEFLTRTNIVPTVFESSEMVGGISRTVNYKGNRIDIGGHRFFSKVDRVMNWWKSFLPIQGLPASQSVDVMYRRQKLAIELNPNGPDPDKVDEVMLVRGRRSSIFYNRQFFDYPITLSPSTLIKLGPVRVVMIGVSYLFTKLFPRKPESTLEDFFINRFGKVLYSTFFKDYTEKVWGVPCNEISADWGAQRVKGLSITTAILHALKKLVSITTGIEQKSTETSLIERFLYPKFGPGQMWETVTRKINEKGGTVIFNSKVVGIKVEGNKIKSIDVLDQLTGTTKSHAADLFFSTMSIKDLIASMGDVVPLDVRNAAKVLPYRDFITVGVLLKDLQVSDVKKYKDNWIYIQENYVKVGRIQVFNNWSPYMVADPSTYWIGLEYFCNEGDALWSMSNEELSKFAVLELEKIGFAKASDVLDTVVIRVPKTYPAYTSGYENFGVIRNFLDSIENLFLLGRNGMHRYNNQDHSMLTAMVAVDNIVAGQKDKENIWAVNTEDEYHEKK